MKIATFRCITLSLTLTAPFWLFKSSILPMGISLILLMSVELLEKGKRKEKAYPIAFLVAMLAFLIMAYTISLAENYFGVGIIVITFLFIFCPAALMYSVYTVRKAKELKVEPAGSGQPM